MTEKQIKELKAMKYLQDYKDYKIDLETLHDALYKIFGSYKKAVLWLYEKWN